MDHNETLRILSVLRASYPNFYRDMGREDLQGIVALWQEMFRDDDYPVVAAAVKALIATDVKGYPPHIGAVKGHIHRLTAPRTLSAQEAWRLVEEAAADGLYGAEQQFGLLPPLLRRLVGGPQQLTQWAMMDGEVFRSVVASNFQRSYEKLTREEAGLALLPDTVRQMLPDLRAEKKGLPQGDLAAVPEGMQESPII